MVEKVSKEKQKDFDFLELRSQTINLKKADFFNKTIFLVLIGLIIFLVSLFSYVLLKYKDRFYVLKGKDIERIYDSMKLSEQVAINNAYDFLEFNALNAKRKIQKVASYCAYKSEAYYYILGVLKGGYVSSVVELGINRLFSFEKVESKKIDLGFKHIITGVQSNVNSDGVDNKDIVMEIDMIFYEITDNNPTGYRIMKIKVDATKKIKDE